MDGEYLKHLNYIRNLVSFDTLDEYVLRIEETLYSPFVYLNPINGKIVFKGECRPPDLDEFLRPIFDFIESNFKEIKYIEGHFILVYFNSSFGKRLLDLFRILNSHYKDGVNVECYWYYEKDDDDMLKVGEEISRIIRMPFKFVEVEDISIIFPSEI